MAVQNKVDEQGSRDLPLISIVTVCLNEHERIELTLKSVIEQNYPKIELILIDGGSTDGTLEIIEKYRDHITHFESGGDGGVYLAMNKALDYANGDYIQFMNGGDTFYANSVLTDIFCTHDASGDLIYGDVSFIYPDGRKVVCEMPTKIGNIFMTFNTICHQALLTRTQLLKDQAGFDTRYKIAADYQSIVEAISSRGASYEHVPITVANFYRDGMSDSQEHASLMRCERIEIQKEFMPWRFQLMFRAYWWLMDRRKRIRLGPLRGVLNHTFDRLARPKRK